MHARPGLLLLFATALTFSTLTRASASVEVPIKGQFTGQVDPQPIAGAPWSFRLEIASKGHVSHLGKAEADWAVPKVTIDLHTWKLSISEPDWFGTITAANGDQIFGEYSFASDVLDITGGCNVEFTLNLVVVGGTGRFQGATGQAIASGKANLLTRTFVIDLDGNLSTPGQARP